ncbi:MAG: DUF5335 family protein [Candidatus Sericytochromatia bacterium]|nr:DUF5335 family protein [Candidatus Tanganyikabacteria bacterium]
MKTRQIERAAWDHYFSRLSNVLHEQPPKVTVELASETHGDAILAEHAPLHGILVDPKGSEAGSVGIEVGDNVSGAREVHTVQQVCVIWVAEDDAGNPVAFDIEGQDPGTREAVKAIIRFEER